MGPANGDASILDYVRSNESSTLNVNVAVLVREAKFGREILPHNITPDNVTGWPPIPDSLTTGIDLQLWTSRNPTRR